MINGWEKLLIKWEAINKNYGRFEIIWRSSILTQSSGINVAVLDWNFNLKYLLMGLKILNNQFIHDIINLSPISANFDANVHNQTLVVVTLQFSTDFRGDKSSAYISLQITVPSNRIFNDMHLMCF